MWSAGAILFLLATGNDPFPQKEYQNLEIYSFVETKNWIRPFREDCNNSSMNAWAIEVRSVKT